MASSSASEDSGLSPHPWPPRQAQAGVRRLHASSGSSPQRCAG